LNAKSLRCTVYEIAPDEFFRCVSCPGGVVKVGGFLGNFFSLSMKKGTRRCLCIAGFAAQAANGYATFVAPRARAMVPSAWASSAALIFGVMFNPASWLASVQCCQRRFWRFVQDLEQGLGCACGAAFALFPVADGLQ
jgi:hypothetical protein